MEQIFSDVTFYLRSEFMGNIQRIDAKGLTVFTGVEYAQYNDAIRVIWRAPRQRIPRSLVLTYKPFLVVVPRHEAIQPDSMLGETDADGCRRGRYSSCDPRWESDFLEKLSGSGATILFTTKGKTSLEEIHEQVVA